MSLSTGRYQLASAFKTLEEQWEGTQATWRDEVRREFAEQQWEPLAGRVPGVLSAIDQLDQILVRLRQDCG
jgi:hypothetical protein